MTAPIFLKDDRLGLFGPRIVSAVLGMIDRLAGPEYGYGWKNPTALPIRPDAYHYASDVVIPAINEACPIGIPCPECAIDSHGVFHMTFSKRFRIQPGMGLVTVPCDGVMLWSKIHDDGVTRTDGVSMGGDIGAVVVVLEDLFDWLTMRGIYEPKPKGRWPKGYKGVKR